MLSESGLLTLSYDEEYGGWPNAISAITQLKNALDVSGSWCRAHVAAAAVSA